ncbi:hypothetical protein [Luteipulveratus halotolerans]|uniref:Uncharacterized protein n=1 Tax=Luteipulveratus halotolerans TaxID=1631356 RepID=A0A0L6CHJ0_9MICO|nr:hypothetical protein [Luteipulveratus halotolerans]KNX37184.1 hypothetical protein VV01_08550 [Luteipulveratus halotolerans]
MDLHIDLDAAAAELTVRLSKRCDLDISPLTWKDMGDDYDTPWATERATIRAPYSVGVEVHRGSEEGRLVLYAGGWADLEYWSGSASDDVVDRAPGYNDWLDVPRFAAVVGEFLEHFRPGG